MRFLGYAARSLALLTGYRIDSNALLTN